MCRHRRVSKTISRYHGAGRRQGVRSMIAVLLPVPRLCARGGHQLLQLVRVARGCALSRERLGLRRRAEARARLREDRRRCPGPCAVCCLTTTRRALEFRSERKAQRSTWLEISTHLHLGVRRLCSVPPDALVAQGADRLLRAGLRRLGARRATSAQCHNVVAEAGVFPGQSRSLSSGEPRLAGCLLAQQLLPQLGGPQLLLLLL